MPFANAESFGQTGTTMNWYYVSGGQQAGPVDDGQLEGLVRSGQVQADTLVWHEGLPNWQPYSQVAPAMAGAPAMPPVMAATAPSGPGMSANEVVCAECCRIFPIESTIQYGNVRVCAGCKPVFMQKLAEGAGTQRAIGAFRYAGFWIRVGAKLIDSLILGVALGIPMVIWMISSGAINNPERFQVMQLFLQLGFMAVSVVYQAFFLSKFGATPGKMACGLKVVTADGGPIGVGRAVGRVFAEILSGMICYIGYIMVGFDSEKRALHDHICSTRVIYK
jgi:uncharacterized RDD family membrane protein YckC